MYRDSISYSFSFLIAKLAILPSHIKKLMKAKELYLHTSNRIESLAERLVEVSREDPLQGLLEQETVMTLNPGTGIQHPAPAPAQVWGHDSSSGIGR